MWDRCSVASGCHGNERALLEGADLWIANTISLLTSFSYGSKAPPLRQDHTAILGPVWVGGGPRVRVVRRLVLKDVR